MSLKVHITTDGSQPNRVPTYCGLPGMDHVTVVHPENAPHVKRKEFCIKCMNKYLKRKGRVRK